MRIRIGYEMDYDFPQPTPMILMLHVHWSRVADLEAPDHLITTPSVALEGYRDSFGNWCTRLTAPAGQVRFSASTVIRDHGTADPQTPDAIQPMIPDLPADTIMFLLGSRYCDTDHLFDVAWQLFGTTPLGWPRVQAICDYVHDHITFGYQHARPTRTAFDAYREGTGVCRDFAHLALAFCRCMNIPARYCTGYISDIGFPPPHSPMDFAAWIEVFLGGQWRVFDPRNNSPRIGRILVARGRDAADVPLTHTFGPSKLTGFKVVTDEVPD
jgi:transglutaminase-like putative cysteine protease